MRDRKGGGRERERERERGREIEGERGREREIERVVTNLRAVIDPSDLSQHFGR